MLRPATPCALCLLLACGADKPEEPPPQPAPATSTIIAPAQLVKVTGISMEVPASFIPLEAPKQERLRAAAAAREPASIVSVDARRAPSGMNAGTAYVLRIELPEDALRGTVRETLEHVEAGLRLEMLLQGSSENQWEAKYEGDRLDLFSRATISQGATSTVLEMRAVVFVSTANRITTVGAQCMADSASLCEPLLRNAKVGDEHRRPFADVLGPPTQRWTGIAGFEFGQSRAAFGEACRAAKHQVDRFNWSKEPAEVRGLVEFGVISRCTGTPQPFADGKVLEAGAYFQRDRLTSLSLYLEEDAVIARKRLFDSHADGIIDLDRGTAYFNLVAKGFEPFLARVDPVTHPSSARVRSAAVFSSRIAFDTPPAR